MKKLGLLLGAVSLAMSARASEDLNGYVGPILQYSVPLKGEDSGRFVGRVEFGRIAKWVALDARVGTGGNYIDFGGNLKFFGTVHFTNELFMNLGGGVLTTYSPGITDPDGIIPKQAFMDVGLNPFARIVYDFKNIGGISFEVGSELMFLRNYLPAEGVDEHAARARLVFALSFMLGV